MALARFQRTLTDTAGNVRNGVEVTVRDESTGGIAAIFSDKAGTTAKNNPVTTDSFGFFSFYTSPGRYRIQATGVDWRDEDLVTVEGLNDAVTAAEAARDAAQLNAGIYADTTAGLAATSDGDYFSTPSGDSNEYLILYRNDTGSATQVAVYPTVAGADEAIRNELVQPVATFNNVQGMIDSTVLTVSQKAKTLGYYSPGDGGGNEYEIVASATGTDDGGSFIDLTGSGHQAKGLFPNGVNVKQFGASGDDATDDSTSINSAITYVNSIGSGSVHIPKGIYRVGSKLVPKADVSLVGDGRTSSVIKAGNSFNSNVVEETVGVSGISLINLGFDGNSANQTAGNIINLELASRFLIRGCRFSDSFNELLILRQCNEGVVTENEFIGSGADGISLTSNTAQGRNIIISNNIVRNPTDSGINVSDQNNITVIGNSCIIAGVTHDTGFGGVRLSNSSTLCTISGNNVEGFDRGIFVVGTAGSLNTIAANTINSTGQQGILSEQGNQFIQGNIIRNPGQRLSPSAGIRLSGTGKKNCIVNGNRVVGDSTNMDSAIHISSDGADNILTSNIGSGATGTTMRNSGGATQVTANNVPAFVSA